MEQKLDIEYPMVTAFESTSNLLAILQKYEQTKPWIYSNFIQMEVLKKFGRDDHIQFYNHHIRFDVCPYLKYQVLNFDLLKYTGCQLGQLIKSVINDKYYVRLAVDISEMNVFHTTKRGIRKILIYGYNEDIFYIAGFFSTSKYEFETCTTEELMQAVGNLDQDNVESKYKDVEFIKYNSIGHYDLDIDFLVSSIEDFINGVNLSLKYKRGDEQKKSHWLYGIKIYDYLETLIKEEIGKTGSVIDVRSFQVLIDQKSIMYKRIEYMSDHGIPVSMYKEDYLEILVITTVIRNMILKYNHSFKSQILPEILERLTDLKEKEKKVLQLLHGALIFYSITEKE